MTTAASRASQVVVVLGAGPGLGFSCARAFALRGHPVALMSRTLPRLQELASKINGETQDEHRAKAYAVDATKRDDVMQAMRQVVKDAQARDPNAHIYTAIHNPGGNFIRKPFLDTTEEDLRGAIDSRSVAFLHFGQAFLTLLKESPTWQKQDGASSQAIGNLLVTGATASTRGGANMSAFAASNFALKAMAQSVAREYGPQGIHVAHFIIDGIIVTERTSQYMGKDFAPDTRMDPGAIADVYVQTAEQPRSVWAFETDLRPFAEKW